MEKESNIIANFSLGKENALTSLFHQYSSPLFFFAMQYLKDEDIAKEIVSDTFVKSWSNRTQFTSMASLKSYLYVVTKNACLNQLRSISRLPKIYDVADVESELLGDQDALTKIIRTELISQLYEQIELLPPLQRQIFKMSFFEDLSTEEIAAKMTIATSSVYMNKSRAINTLRKKMNVDDRIFTLLLLLLVR
ncbi:RNA polymerase sigma factor [Sphingobacterium detergens]|uniref:RNA polymerase sigma-70 factor (ECF subfamily) n=1 Tax=Sphingobacterium detergens TaxID=1145106 RepID=A0A420BGI9_SPHD1|nr:RNA polymerase sigma-70 factor [Sphingobacterium detergens]RKE55844.1 RNA polymerase sigma-70 factor (ECF subfamily) [Sphingobacterium detergens]